MCSQRGHDLMQTLMFTVQRILLSVRKQPNGQRLNLLRHRTLPPRKLKQKICSLRTQFFVSTLFQLLKQRSEIGLALVPHELQRHRPRTEFFMLSHFPLEVAKPAIAAESFGGFVFSGHNPGCTLGIGTKESKFLQT